MVCRELLAPPPGTSGSRLYHDLSNSSRQDFHLDTGKMNFRQTNNPAHDLRLFTKDLKESTRCI